MTRQEHKLPEYKNNGDALTNREIDDFYEIRLNYAIVLNTDPRGINKLNHFLKENGYLIRYKKPSTKYLKIIEENNYREG